MQDFWPKLIISLGAVVVIVVRIVLFGLQFDAFTIGLLIIALLPWLSQIFNSIESPGGLKVKYREIEKVQERQQSEIDRLNFLFSNFVTNFEFEHLQKLESEKPFPFNAPTEYTSFFARELRRLRDLHLIDNYPDRGVDFMLGQKQGNVKDYFFITEAGRKYLELRRHIEAKASRSL